MATYRNKNFDRTKGNLAFCESESCPDVAVWEEVGAEDFDRYFESLPLRELYTENSITYYGYL